MVDKSTNFYVIKRVKWDRRPPNLSNNIPMDEETFTLSTVAEDIAIVADALEHAYKECEEQTLPMDTFLERANEMSYAKESSGTEETSPKIPEDGLPEHISELFLQTIASKELSHEAEKGLEQLLWDHQDTSAKSKTDIGFCSLVKHDILGRYRRH